MRRFGNNPSEEERKEAIEAMSLELSDKLKFWGEIATAVFSKKENHFVEISELASSVIQESGLSKVVGSALAEVLKGIDIASKEAGWSREEAIQLLSRMPKKVNLRKKT